MMLEKKNGFTLVETVVAMMLVTVVIAMTIPHIPQNIWQPSAITTDLGSDILLFQESFTNYNEATGSFPTGLGDTTYVPAYVSPPPAPAGFDLTYGMSGFFMGQQTGQPLPNNGYYLCARASVPGTGSAVYQGIKNTAAKLSSTQFFYNSSCPATGDMADPVGAATVYVTYWFKRG